MGLHENICVQRSPSHLQTGTFYWAHVGRRVVASQHAKLTSAASTRSCA
jgi:hypothetical protein